jgi:hypothetical protein
VGAVADPELQGNVLHPHIGFVRRHNPGGLNFVNGRKVGVPVNPHGFFGRSPLAPRGDDVVRVALAGGSVALELYLVTKRTLIDELERQPAFAGRKVELVSLALGGLKQPQQLMALAWFALLDAPLDVVINLDGFNEIALPVTDIQPAGIFPFFPTRWPRLAASQVDIGSATLLGRIALLRDRREGWRRSASAVPWRYSSFVLALWSGLDTRLRGEEIALDEALRARMAAAAADRSDFPVVGPPYEVAPGEDAIPDAVAVWARASRMMAQLAAENGIVYRQFLQPNQNVSGSKVLTAREREVAVGEQRYRYRWIVENGWSQLRAAGAQLAREGVGFTDLTMMFADTPEQVYRDQCCHLTDHGYRLLALRIVEEVGRSLPSTPPAR